MRELSAFEKVGLAGVLLLLIGTSIHFYLTLLAFNQSLLTNTDALLSVPSQTVQSFSESSVILEDGSSQSFSDSAYIVGSVPTQWANDVLFISAGPTFIVKTFWVLWVFSLVMLAAPPLMFRVFSWSWPTVSFSFAGRSHTWRWFRTLYLVFAFFSAVFLVSSLVPLFL